MSLRDLAANATPGPWSAHVNAWESVRRSKIPLRDEDARLIALAPDLAQWAADAADALAMDYVEHDDPPVAALLARYREIEARAALADTAPAEDGGNHRKETEPSVPSQ